MKPYPSFVVRTGLRLTLLSIITFLVACRGTPALPEIVEKLQPSTVMIRAKFPETAISGEVNGSGTGIVWTEEGYIITNAHVVEGASSVTVATAGNDRERPAQVVGISACDDLAVLKVDNTEELTAATLGQSGALRVGEQVLALGYPLGERLGIDPSATSGIVSRLDALIPGLSLESLIQTDTTINHGNSGGPLVNIAGEVVGINTLTSNINEAVQTNFAISLDKAMPILEVLQGGNSRNQIGMNLTSNDYADYFLGYEGGLVVNAIASGGSASHINVQPADLLTRLEGSTVNSQKEICEILRSHSDGDQLKIQVVRVMGEELHILEGEITIGQADDDVDELEVVKVVKVTPAPTQPQAQETPAPSPSATPEPTAEAAETSSLLFEEKFANNTSSADWPLGEFADDDAKMVYGVADERYYVSLTTLNYDDTFYDGAFLPEVSAQNFHLQFDAELVQFSDNLAPDTPAIAISLRNNGGNEYLIYLADQEYQVWLEKGGSWKLISDSWVQLDQLRISRGVVNHLDLMVKGSNISIKVNEQNLPPISDSSLSSSGQILLGAAVWKANQNAVYAFDNIKVDNLD